MRELKESKDVTMRKAKVYAKWLFDNQNTTASFYKKHRYLRNSLERLVRQYYRELAGADLPDERVRYKDPWPY